MIAVISTVHLTAHSRILAGTFAVCFIGLLLELIRRHRLQERYTVLWLAVGAIVLALAVIPGLLNLAVGALGVRDSNVALFSIMIGGLVLVVLHLTVVISRQGEQITRLAQELAITQREERTPSDQADS